MLEIRHLVKHFGPLKAVDDISFTVPRGEVLGFLGPNGAGKSTTMKMITGFLAPTSGTAIVCGHDIAAQPIPAKKCIGYLPEGAPAYPDMTPADFLDFIAHGRILADGPPAELAERSRHHNAVRLGVAADPQVRADLMRLPGVAAVEPVSDGEGEALMIFAEPGRAVVTHITELARAHGWEVTGLRVERGRLDDVFREITTVPAEPAPIAAAAA